MEMSQAEELDGLAPEQCGIRASKVADIQALNTSLFYDLIRLKRIPSTSIFAYLISNYDLVVHIIYYISLQSFNAPKDPIMFT